MNAMELINVGDIFSSSWGYDQTNVDFYKVTRKTKSMIELSPISGRVKYLPGGMAGMASPDLKSEPGAPIGLKKPKAYEIGGQPKVYVTLTSYSSASKVENPETYEAYCSWYA